MPNFGQVREFLTATVATQIFVLPLLLYLIGELSLVSVLVNVAVLPFVPLAMLLTFLTGLFGLLSPSLATLVGFPAHLTLSYIIFMAETFAELPLAAFSVKAFPFLVVPIAYGAIFLSLWFYGRQYANLIPADNLISKPGVELAGYQNWQIKAEVIKPDR